MWHVQSIPESLELEAGKIEGKEHHQREILDQDQDKQDKQAKPNNQGNKQLKRDHNHYIKLQQI